MVRVIVNAALLAMFLTLGALVVPFSYKTGQYNKFETALEQATVQTVQDRNILYTAFDRPIINHCDVTVSAFLDRDELTVALPTLIIPKEQAKSGYSLTENTILGWNIPPNTQPGVYVLTIHVKNDCNMLSGSSVRLDRVKVEITSW